MAARVSNSKPDNSMVNILLWTLVLSMLSAGIFAFYYFSTKSLLLRVLGLLAVAAMALYFASRTKGGKLAFGYWGDAVQEVRRVVWPTRQETRQSTLAVLAMVFVMGVLLWSVDAILIRVMAKLLGHGG